MNLWSPSSATRTGTISDNDAIIFFNYRPDRAREITRAFVDPAFDGFQREVFPRHLRLQHRVRRHDAERARRVPAHHDP